MRLQLLPRLISKPTLVTKAIVAAGFALIGTVVFVQSQAATGDVISEAEDGTLAGQIASVADLTASGSKAVQFGGGAPLSVTGIPLEFCPDIAAGKCRPYNPNGPWNTPISNPVVHPNSANYIARIIAGKPQSNNPGVLTSDPTQCTIPVYIYNSSTPRASVITHGYFSYYDNGDNSRVPAPGNPGATIPSVPIPAVAASEGGCDSQITFWNPLTGEEWAFWLFGGTTTTGYSAENGWRYKTTAANDGRFADGRSGRGAGTPYFAGLVRKWEIDQGRIDHALAMAFSGPSPEFVYPASKSDGANFGGVAGVDVPEGARLQLDPSLTEADFTAWGLNNSAKIVARALQKYGTYVIDNSGSTKLYIELQATANWDTTQVNRSFLSAIPLNRFRVLEFPAAPSTPTPTPTPSPGTDATAPTVPANITVAPGSGQLGVNWTASTDDVAVTGYDLHYRPSGASVWVDVPLGTVTNHTISGLTNGVTYNIQIRSKDASGKTSAYSSLVQGIPR